MSESILAVQISSYGASFSSILNRAIGGTIPGTNYGQLEVSGPITLNGTLSVNLTNYVPVTNTSFTLVTAGSVNDSGRAK